MSPSDSLNRAYDEVHRLLLLDADQRVREWMKGTSGFPSLSCAQSGEEVPFTDDCLEALGIVSAALFEESPGVQTTITRTAFEAVARSAFADCCVDSGFDRDASHRLGLLRRRILERIADQAKHTQTHFFPAWTLGLERDGAFSLGPATFETKEQWLCRTQTTAVRDRVQAVWNQLLDATQLDSHELGIVSFVGDGPSVISIPVEAKDLSLSKETASYAARLALDGLALWFGRLDLPRELVLAQERSLPRLTRSLTRTETGAWLPSTTLNPRGWVGKKINGADFMDKMRVQLDATGGALKSLTEEMPTRHAPGLDRRWLTSLFWYGEACREPHTFVAIGKLGVSLDVLSGGGEGGAILEMATNLTGKNPEDIVVPGRSMTLKRMVKAIYSDGRSQILHGGRLGLLEPLDHIHHYATDLARVALRSAIVRLHSYRGADSKEAFRNMK